MSRTLKRWLTPATLAMVSTYAAMPAHALQETAEADQTAAPEQTAASQATQDSIDRAASKFAELLELEQQIDELLELEASQSGEDSLLTVQRRLRRVDDILSMAESWAELVARLGPDHPDLQAQLAQAGDLFTRAWTSIRADRLETEALLVAMRVPRDTLGGAALIEHEKAIARIDAILDANVDELSKLAAWSEDIGLDFPELTQEADSVMRSRADDLADRVRIVVELRRDLRSAIERAPESEAEALALDMLALEERLDTNAGSLQAMVRLLAPRGVDTAEYRQLLITATGELTTDILDTRVAIGLAREGLGRVTEWLSTEGVQLLFRLMLFAVIIGLALLTARLVRMLVNRSFDRSGADTSQLLRETVLSISGKTVIVLGLVVGLGQMGAQIGALLAGLGVAGFIVGFALQDTLGNFASGFMIVTYQPYDIGDLVEVAGVRGKVSSMSLVATSIKTVDNQLLVIPNNRIWGDVIRNVTSQRVRRVDLTFEVAYNTDLDEAAEVLRTLVEEHQLVLQEPEPKIKVHNLGDSSVTFIVRPWCRTADYWEVYWDLTKGAKEALDAAGIGIPFPQRDVHVHMVSGSDDEDSNA